MKNIPPEKPKPKTRKKDLAGTLSAFLAPVPRNTEKFGVVAHVRAIGGDGVELGAELGEGAGFPGGEGAKEIERFLRLTVQYAVAR